MKNSFVKILVTVMMSVFGVVFAVLCAQFSEAFGICLMHNDSQMWADLSGALITLLCTLCCFTIAKYADEIFEE